MADTNLYSVLTGLHQTDKNMWGKLSGVQDRLSGLISGAFTENRIAIGDGSKLVASQYTFDATTTSGAFAVADGIGTRIANEAAVKAYVDDSIAAQSAAQGTALTGVTVAPNDGALTVSVANKQADFTLTTDNVTVGQDANGLKSLLTLKKLSSPNSAYAAQYQLWNAASGAVGDTINIPKDQFLSGASYDKNTEKLVLTFAIKGEGDATVANTVDVPVGDLVHEYTGSQAITVTYDAEHPEENTVISLKLDNSSENFLTVGEGGLKLSGVQDAIDAASLSAQNGLTTLSSALTNYLSANAVSNEFAAVDGRLDALEAATSGGLSGVAANTNIIIGAGTAEQVKSSDYTLGTGTFAATPDATTVATEAGVSGFVYSKVNAAADKIVLGNDANSTKDSGVAIKAQGSETAVQMAADSDTEVPTSKAVATYVNDGLAELLVDVNTLKNSIGA